MSSKSSSDLDSSDHGEDDHQTQAWSRLALRDVSGTAAISVPTDSAAAALSFGEGHALHCGPPFLRCSMCLGHSLCFVLEPDELRDSAARNACVTGRAAVSVDWTDAPAREVGQDAFEYTLSLRLHGHILHTARGCRGQPLALDIELQRAMPGECFVAALEWPGGGSRHLHVVAPPSCVKLTNLVAPPNRGPLPAEALLEAPLACPLPPEFTRGFGVELELMTVKIVGGVRKQREWRDMLARCAHEHPASSDARASARLAALLERCASWVPTVDNHIMTSSLAVAEQMVGAESEAMKARHEMEDEHFESAADFIVCLASGGDGALPPPGLEEMGDWRALKTEFVSPAPPHELSFSRGAAEEIAAVMRLIRHAGAAAPSVSRVWHGGASTHVHVNVASSKASGKLLDPLAILNVFLHWVRYDLVISRLARPWMWREPSSAPLYATGAEFAWAESGFHQGSSAHPSSASTYDVPTFIRGCRQVVNARGFSCLSTHDQLERLFGGSPKGTAPGSTPGALLGRHGSMNLRRLTTYGTLEIRRFHGTLDEASVTHWAAFCVAFVEHFQSGDGRLCDDLLSDDDVTAGTALLELQRAQEEASVGGLISELAHVIDSRCITFLVEDACPTSRQPH
jgi:hypothetical protein